MTVGQLREALAGFDDTLPVYCRSYADDDDYGQVEDIGVEELMLHSEDEDEEGRPLARCVCINRFA